MAVLKVHFCALWGIEIGVEDWPSEGLPPHPTLDRGPGSQGVIYWVCQRDPRERARRSPHGPGKGDGRRSASEESQDRGTANFH